MIWLVRDNTTEQFSFYLVFSLKNDGVIAVFQKIMFMPSRDQKCVAEARKWLHAVHILLAIILVLTWSLWLKNWLRKCVFRKIHVCDLLWPSRSPQVTGHVAKWKAVYEFLSTYNCKHRLIWKRYWDIDMQHFCNPWLHFEWRFSRIFSRNVSFLWLGPLEIIWRIILVFTWGL